MDLNKYPNQLTANRLSTEAAFVFSLWNDPELYGEYENINTNKQDKTLLTEDGQFYFLLGRKLYESGYRNFDDITIHTYLQSYQEIKRVFDLKGGLSTVQDLKKLVDADNIDGYYDAIVKSNVLLKLYDKGFDVLGNLDKFKEMNSEEVYDYFEYQLNSVAIETNHSFEVENLLIDDQFIDECNSGIARGLQIGKNVPILNSITMGLPLGELFMIGGFSGSGKTSFAFENMILPLNEQGIKCTIISNEQRSKDFKMLLLIHVLVQDLKYEGLNRRNLKKGDFTEEELLMLKKAQKIIEEKYADIQFVKLFDNDTEKVKKIIKKSAKVGHQVFLYDTMKSEDQVDDLMWQQLLMQSRKLFQLASKENVSIICTYQLALSKLNTRYLDASCLSNAKQIKEVFSEMVYFRALSDDEYEGEKYYVEPYKLEIGDDGKTTGRKLPVKIDRDKRYLVAFIDKTRNDQDRQQILYEFEGKFNRWEEIGHCRVLHTLN